MTRKRIRKERGFIQLSVLGWAVLGMGTVVLILGTMLKVQTARLDDAIDKVAEPPWNSEHPDASPGDPGETRQNGVSTPDP